MQRPRYTPIVGPLPSTVPFVGPETQERNRRAPFAARIGANESVFGPSPRAVEAMARAWIECGANPASQHSLGRKARRMLEEAREGIAELLGAKTGGMDADQLIFTSGGTESNNAALHSATISRGGRRNIVTTQVEHSSVLNFCKYLSGQDHRVTFLGVDEQGRLDLNDLRRAVDEKTALVSIMTANNETGVIFPVAEIAAIAHERGALQHGVGRPVGRVLRPVRRAEQPVAEDRRVRDVRERALALDPNGAWAWTRWGWIGIYRADPTAALLRFQKAIKLSPLDPFAFNTRMGMASALACSGRSESAVAIAKDVTRKHPNVTWGHRLLASWAAMAGDMETARSAARKLLAASPDFTIRHYLPIPGFQDMPEYHARLAQGLRDAGLPEG